MKRFRLCLLCLLMLSLLCACASPSTLLRSSVTTLAPGSQGILPEPLDPVLREASKPSALYFRMEDEAYLGSEFRYIQRTGNVSYETALIQALLSGPSVSGLTSLFPQGTRLLSTAVSGRTLFVTFSEELMQPYADEPVDWQEYDYWLTECPLRRKLCMQALTATLTENSDLDRIQVLVEQDASETGTLRLKQNYFLDDSEDSVLAEPFTRSSAYLLTPSVSLQRILNLYIARSWDRLYASVADTDSQTGLAKPNYTDFLAQMDSLPRLTSFTLSGFGLSLDGSEATFAVSGQLTTQNARSYASAVHVLRLQRTDGLWKISMPQLTAWLEEERP